MQKSALGVYISISVDFFLKCAIIYLDLDKIFNFFYNKAFLKAKITYFKKAS